MQPEHSDGQSPEGTRHASTGEILAGEATAGRDTVAGQVPVPGEPGGISLVGSRSRGFRVELFQTTTVNLGLAATNAVTGILVARMLLPAGRGELAAILNVPTLLGVVAGLGLPEALVYFTSKDRNNAGRYLGTALSLSLTAAAFLTIVGWLAMPALLDAQSAEVVRAARWYLLQVPVAAVIGLVLRPLRGLGEHRWWNLLRVIPTAVWLFVLLAALTRPAVTPGDLALAFVVLRACTIPIFVGIVRWRIRDHIRTSKELARPLLRYGAPNVLAVLPNELNYRLDQLLLAALLPKGALGIYVVAVAWSQLQSPLLLAFGTLLFPRVASVPSMERQRPLVARGLRTAVLVSGCFSAALAAITPSALPVLFGSEFDAAIPTAVVLTFAAGVAGVNLVAQEAARGLGMPRAVLIAQLGGLLATVLSLAALLGSLRIFGAALASLVGYSVIGVILLLQLRDQMRAPLKELILPREDDLRKIWSLVRRTGSSR